MSQEGAFSSSAPPWAPAAFVSEGGDGGGSAGSPALQQQSRKAEKGDEEARVSSQKPVKDRKSPTVNTGTCRVPLWRLQVLQKVT